MATCTVMNCCRLMIFLNITVLLDTSDTMVIFVDQDVSMIMRLKTPRKGFQTHNEVSVIFLFSNLHSNSEQKEMRTRFSLRILEDFLQIDGSML